MWSNHRTDGAGDRVGPIVTWGDVDTMANHFESANEVPSAGGIDTYLANNLQAVPVERYNEFNTTFAASSARAEAAAVEREEMKAAKKEKTKGNKLAKVEKMLDDLADLILINFRDIAMKRLKSKSFEHKSAKMTTTPCICLETPFIKDLLNPYILTPSKMKKKILKELADTINEKLCMIAEKNLLTFEFLSDSDPFEAALKQYFGEKLPDLAALFELGKRSSYQTSTDGSRIHVNKVTAQFFSFLENDQSLGALAYLVDDNMSFTLLTTEPFATASRSDTSLVDSTLESVAKDVWRRCLRETGDDSDERFGKAYVASQEYFRDALAAFDEYSTWLVEKYGEDEEAKRNYLIENVFGNTTSWGGGVSWGPLLKKDFETLHKYQTSSWTYRNRFG